MHINFSINMSLSEVLRTVSVIDAFFFFFGLKFGDLVKHSK